MLRFLLIGLVMFTYVSGVLWVENMHTKIRRCNYLYTTLSDYEKCTKEPFPWEKK